MRYIASDRPRELALTTGKHLYAPCAAFLASMARACTGLLLLSAASALRQPQTVTLRDVHSKRDVTLVGAMHYNPVNARVSHRSTKPVPSSPSTRLTG